MSLKYYLIHFIFGELYVLLLLLLFIMKIVHRIICRLYVTIHTRTSLFTAEVNFFFAIYNYSTRGVYMDIVLL